MYIRVKLRNPFLCSQSVQTMGPAGYYGPGEFKGYDVFNVGGDWDDTKGCAGIVECKIWEDSEGNKGCGDNDGNGPTMCGWVDGCSCAYNGLVGTSACGGACGYNSWGCNDEGLVSVCMHITPVGQLGGYTGIAQFQFLQGTQRPKLCWKAVTSGQLSCSGSIPKPMQRQ